MKVAVFFGGKSVEHDVSVITGIMAMNLLSSGGHEVIPVYITREGEWTLRRERDARAYRGEVRAKRLFVRPNDPSIYAGRGRRYATPDVALLCVHGAGGEDGGLPAILESAGIAYTGSGICASAAGLNKRVSKALFAAAGLNVLPYVAVTRREYENELAAVIERIRALGGEVIVKPASLGSSIGVSRAADGRGIIAALALAFTFDGCAVVERALDGFIELNCAVLSDGRTAEVSEVERPLRPGEFLTFSDKYEGGAFSGGERGREFPAGIPAELRDEVRRGALEAYRAIGAEGAARVDFLYDPAEQKLYVNEINTVPGSLALYLFALPTDETPADKAGASKGVKGGAAGMCGKAGKSSVVGKSGKVGKGGVVGKTAAAALEKLLMSAVRAKRARDRLTRTFESSLV